MVETKTRPLFLSGLSFHLFRELVVLASDIEHVGFRIRVRNILRQLSAALGKPTIILGLRLHRNAP